ncbi:MAG: phosphotransferase [Fimbriimonadaceae bacterium]|nr:phosphotransferase [Fimbriimonadaceae bacterium]
MSRELEIVRALEQLQVPHLQTTIEPLSGGMSCEMFLVTLDNGRRLTARFPSPYVRSILDDPADYEARTLAAIHVAGVPVPEVIGFGKANEGRFLLLEYVEGICTAKFANPETAVDEMAGMLAAIHSVPLDANLSHLLPTNREFRPRDELNETIREPEIVAALQAMGEPQWDHEVLRHGDFWPGNLLWDRDEIVGVIDWENALRGPAIADLAISRLDVAWVLGFDAMQLFTQAYIARRPLDLTWLPYWDLRAALRPMSNLEEWAGPYGTLNRPDISEIHLREGLLRFVENALARIPH